MVQIQNKRGLLAPDKSDGVAKLSAFFTLAYLCHGFSCAQFGLMAQPIQYFFMKGLNLNAAQSSTIMATMMLPWIVKPIYGLICDFIPLFGFRRKSYLAIANLIGSTSFGLIALFATLDYKLLLTCLVVSAVCMAVSTALMVGTATERGRIDGHAHRYFGIQEIAYYSANIAAAIFAGHICQTMPPLPALRYCAVIAIVPSLIVSGSTLSMLDERRSKLDLAGFRKTQVSLIAALKSRALWLVALLTLSWNFIPCFGVPLYYFESKALNFPQSSIGDLAAWNSLGMLFGSIFYTILFKKFSLKVQLLATVSILTGSVLSFCFLSTLHTAIAIETFHGFANIIAILSVYIIATKLCPRRIEITVMAVLVAVRNIATDGATFAGGQLFTNLFHDSFHALVLASVAAPILSILLVATLLKHLELQQTI